MSETSFSMVVPVGAWSPRLGATLRSLARQDPRPSVALFDASGDRRVRALADAFDDLLTVRRHGPDGGQADAIARGWAQTPGAYLGWLNADDFLAPGALAAAADAFSSADADVVYGQSAILDEGDVVLGRHPAVEPPSDRLRRGCIISQPSCFARREAVEAVGGLDRALEYTMDWDLWSRLWEAGMRFEFMDASLSAVTWARGTKTASLGPRRLSEIRRIVARGRRPATTAKTLIGFTLHHLTTYSRLAGLAGLARRARAGRAGPDGWMRLDAAPVALFHEHETPRELVIEARGARAELRVAGDGAGLIEIGVEAGGRASVSVPPGEVRQACAIAPAREGRVRFSWAREDRPGA